MLRPVAGRPPSEERYSVLHERVVERERWLADRADRRALAPRHATRQHSLFFSSPYRMAAIDLPQSVLRRRAFRHISSVRSRQPATAGYDPGNQKLPGGSQPPTRDCRALALQRKGDLSSRADFERLGCVRPIALRRPDRAG